MANPSIDELQNSGRYELIAVLGHDQVKEFVLGQLMSGGRIIRYYMYYQVAMILTGMFFITRALVLAFKNNPGPLGYTIAAAVFSFTILVVIHELLHGLALKLTGAPKVSYGGYLRKFMFYAEADRHVMNRNQFALVALIPLVVVQVITAAGIILLISHPAVYFPLFVMSAHSLFCAGDIGLLSVFYKNENEDIFTYDVQQEKKSYYYCLNRDSAD